MDQRKYPPQKPPSRTQSHQQNQHQQFRTSNRAGFGSICYNTRECSASKYIQQIEEAKNTILARISPETPLNIPIILKCIDVAHPSPQTTLFLSSFLLSYKDHKLVMDLLLRIFRGDLATFSNGVFQAISDVYFRSYNELTRDAEANFKIIYEFFSNAANPQEQFYHTSLIQFVCNSIESGSFTDKSLYALSQCIEDTKKFRHLKVSNEFTITLILKLLRFYQDHILMVSAPKRIAPSGDTDRIKKVADTISQKNISFLIDLFKSKSQDVLVKIPKEISRILYDPRSYVRMRPKFEQIYQVVEMYHNNLDMSCTSEFKIMNCSISNRISRKLILIYSEFLGARSNQEKMNHVMMRLTDIFAPDAEMFDIDLIAGDIVRYILQPGFLRYSNNDPSPISQFLCVLYTKMHAIYTNVNNTEKQSILITTNEYQSFLNAIVSDLFFCPQAIPVEKKSVIYFYAQLFFFFNQETFQLKMIQIIANRIANNDFSTYKKHSLATVLSLYEKFMPPPNNFQERLLAYEKRLGNEKCYRELLGILTLKDAQMIPEVITSFHQRNMKLNTVEAMNVVGVAAEFLQQIVSEVLRSGVLNDRAAQIMNRTVSCIMPNPPEYVNLIFDRIPFFASYLYSIKIEPILRLFLQYVDSKALYSSMEEYYPLLSQDYQNELETYMIHFIRDKTVRWQNFVQKLHFFRNSENIMQTICFYESVSSVTEIIDYEKYNILNLITVANNNKWPPDACMNLVNLLKSFFLCADDFLENADFIMEKFSLFPQFAITFMENQIKLLPLTKALNAFIAKIYNGGGKCAEWAKDRLRPIIIANQPQHTEIEQSQRKPSGVIV